MRGLSILSPNRQDDRVRFLCDGADGDCTRRSSGDGIAGFFQRAVFVELDFFFLEAVVEAFDQAVALGMVVRGALRAGSDTQLQKAIEVVETLLKGFADLLRAKPSLKLAPSLSGIELRGH